MTENKRICTFCNKETQYVPFRVGAYPVMRDLPVFYCEDCKAEYVYTYFYKHEDPFTTSLYTEINSRMYRWTVDPAGAAHLWYVGIPGIPGVKPNRDMKMVRSFTIFPNITPQNIEEKLRFILLFL